MATKKKMLEAAAGGAGGAGLDITEVFSTYLYTGTGFSQSIVNEIDLAGEGGLTWVKWRSGSATAGNNTNHILVDSETGTSGFLESDTTNARTATAAISSFNSNGFTTGGLITDVDNSGDSYASWTFRKAPKFFDCVTWTGDGTSNRAIPHNLNGAVGSYFVKCTSNSSTSDWIVWHKDLSSNAHHLVLNTTAEQENYNLFSTTAPDSSNVYLGTTYSDFYNGIGRTYVAYLFAHNDSGDGEFGPDSDQDIIKCGSYTGNESSFPTVDLGFEPQFLLLKNATASGEGWLMMDTMRGWLTDGNNSTGDFKSLRPYNSGGEGGSFFVNITSTGFELTAADAEKNSNGNTFIYMAVRRGQLALPEAGTEVFMPVKNVKNVSPTFYSGWPVDFGIGRYMLQGFGSSNKNYAYSRLTGNRNLQTYSNAAEGGTADDINFYSMTGVDLAIIPAEDTDAGMAWLWKRAPGYFDVVCYTGNSTAGRTVSHNVLGVAPEMIWVKSRSAGDNWYVYHKDLTSAAYALILNSTSVQLNAPTLWNSTAPTDSVFTVGSDGGINGNTKPFIAYLFASLDGVSKVGSYTADGNAQNIDCGFTSGARFVLIKRTDTGGNWFVLDTVRGIVSGNDPLLELNSTSAEDNSYDNMDPYSAGFTITAYGGTSPYLNISGGSYIFYAIA